MKTLAAVKLILCILGFTFVLGLTASCKQKDNDTSLYVKQLSDMAVQLNKSCPNELKNGTRLESVTFADNTLTYRMSLSDQAIVTVNLDQTRDSLIQAISEKVKRFLVKGNCNFEYKYVSPNDSSSITIVPSEFKDDVSTD